MALLVHAAALKQVPTCEQIPFEELRMIVPTPRSVFATTVRESVNSRFESGRCCPLASRWRSGLFESAHLGGPRPLTGL